MSAANLRAWDSLGKMLPLQPVSGVGQLLFLLLPAQWLGAACRWGIFPVHLKCQSPVRLSLPAQKSMHQVEWSGLKSRCCMNDPPKGPIFGRFPEPSKIVPLAGGCKPLEVGPRVSCTWTFSSPFSVSNSPLSHVPTAIMFFPRTHLGLNPLRPSPKVFPP